MVLELTEEQKKAGWQVKQLGELCESIDYGFTASATDEDTGTKFLRITDIKSGYCEADSVPFVEVNDAERKKYLLHDGDIVVARTGATTGVSAWLKNPKDIVFASYLVRFAVKKSEYNSRFVSYLLKTETFKKYIYSVLAEKSAQPNASAATIAKATFLIPPLEQQNHIAEVLGSVDDKIEANSRLIDSLEELADLTFDSYLENLADELETTTYASLNFFGGGTPNTKTPEYWDGEINWVTPTDVTSLKSHVLFESSRKITEEGLSACSSKLHPAGSIMMTSRATVGRFAVNQVPAATNQGFIIVQPENEVERWWIYHHMKKDVELFLQLANGATFLELSRKVFRDIPLKIYRGKTELPDIHKQIIALEAENRSLVETRDLLIRHLIK